MGNNILSRRKLTAIAFIVSQTFISMPAFAAGFQINEISPSLQGDASAGAAAANNDVSSMFINPATLSTLKSNQVYVGASEIMPKIRMSDASAIHTINVPGPIPVSITAPVLGKNSQSNIGQGAFVPDGYASWRINDRLVAGLALVAPFGLKTHYDNDSVLRFAADYSSVKTIDIVPALSYAINNQWSVGVGFQAQYLKGEFSNFDGAYTGDPATDAVLMAATNPTFLQAHGWGYGYTLGALYQPDLCTRIGLGYRSMISEQLRGHGHQYLFAGPTVPAPSQDAPFNAETSVHGAIKTPAIITLSAARDYYDWTVKASAQVNFWNTFNHLSIYMPDAFATNATFITKWKNAWFGSLGAEYRATPIWTLRGGIAYDQTPTRDAYRDPRIPDNDRYWANIGASYKFNNTISIDGAYSHLFIHNQRVNVTQASGSSDISSVPLEVNQVYAKYKGYADIVALAARFSF